MNNAILRQLANIQATLDVIMESQITMFSIAFKADPNEKINEARKQIQIRTNEILKQLKKETP